jgi:DNA-binding NtrC family response regulator
MNSARRNPILLVDDEADFLQSLALTLRLAGLTNLTECSDSRRVEKLLAEQDFSLAIVDLVMPHVSGEEVLAFIRKNYPQVPVLILTGMDQVELAVRCIKGGALDYYPKTTESERLIAGILRALRTAELQNECSQLKTTLLTGQLNNPEVFSDIVTNAPQMNMVFKYLEAISGSPEPVLITGESGVGKELIAKSLHRLSGPSTPWVAVNVAGLDDNIFSDTLFGHERGAFTGADKRRPGMVEEASGGILFLDEIGDLPLESQIKLLRLLQEGEYFPLGSDRPKQINIRIIVATNLNLEERQAKGLFRKDLYYRLCAHHVEIPALKDRKEDIPLLLELFLEEAAKTLGKKKPSYPPELLTLLSLHHYPGNVRELRAMVYDAVSIHRGKMLSMDSFRQALSIGSDTPVLEEIPAADEAGLGFYQTLPTLKHASDLLVAEAMKRTNGNQAMAARLLGITPPSMSSRLKKMRD